MTWIESVARQFGIPARANRHARRAAPTRLGLTRLEDRTVPAVVVWDGGGADDNWTTAANWVGDLTPSAGDDLVFAAGAARLTNVNDFAAGTDFGQLTFDAAGYDVSGNAIDLLRGMTATYSSGVSEFRSSVALTSTQAFTVATGGTLILTGSGVISGAGFGLTKEGGGQLTLAGGSLANSYTGPTTVNDGILALWKSPGVNAVGGNLVIGDGTHPASVVLQTPDQIPDASSVTLASGATLDLGGFNETVGGLNLTGATVATGSGTLTLAGDVTTNFDGSTSVISGNLDLGGATRTFTVADNAALDPDLTISANISGTGAGIIKTGVSSQLRLSGNNTYDGTTTLSQGTLGVSSSANLGTGNLVVGPSVGNTLEFAGSDTFANDITLLANCTFLFGSGVSVLLSGDVTGAGGFTKQTLGTLTLDGTNTYAGPTTIRGRLIIGDESNLGAGAVTLTPGGALEVTGASAAIGNDISLLAGNGTIDHSNGGGNLALSGVISGAGQLTKTGIGNVVLSGANTYTGDTIVSGGTLVVNGTLSGGVTVASGATLGGLGTIDGAAVVQSGGTLSPGNSPGGQTFNAGLTLASGGTLAVDLNGTTPVSQYDQIHVAGTVDLTGATLAPSLGFTPAVGDTFRLIDNDGSDAVVGTFAGLAEGATFTSGATTFRVSYVGGTGNDVTLTAVVPTITGVTGPADGTYVAGQDLDFTVTFDEPVTVTGTPRVALYVGNGIVFADAVSGTATTLVFRYTVQTADRDSNGIGAISPVILNGGTIRDAAGNDAGCAFTPPDLSGVLVDGIPRISSVTPPVNGTYTQGQILDFTVEFTRAVFVDTTGGSPRVALFLDSGGVYADYVSGNGTTSLLFRHTVQPGDSDADGLFLGSPINLSGGTIRDSFGNNADIHFPPPVTTGVLVDGVAPSVAAVLPPADGIYDVGQDLDFTVTFDEPVTVTGTPRVGLTVGAATVFAAYLSGSGTTSLLFRYTAQPGDVDADGIAVVSPVDPNGGTIRDAAGNEAALTFTPPTTTGVRVDTVAPTVSVTLAAGQASSTDQTRVRFAVTFSEPVTGFTAARVTIDGTSGATVASVTGSGANYIVTVTDVIGDGTVNVTVSAGAGTDAAGHSNMFSATSPNITHTTPVSPPTVPPAPAPAPTPMPPVLVATAPNSGPDGTQIKVFDPATGQNTRVVVPFAGFAGAVDVTTGDLNGDGVPDVVVGAGATGGPRVRIFDGATGAVLADFFAFSEQFTGGVNVAVGDVDGDGTPDLIVAAGAGGGPHVKVFDGQSFAQVRSFYAYAADFTGGVKVAAGDVDGDGKADIITGAGPGGGPNVRVFSGADLNMLRSFYAFAPTFGGGVNVAAGDVNGDGFADVVTGAGAGGSPTVTVFDGKDGTVRGSFLAFDGTFAGGVRVGVTDADGDGQADIVAAAGPGGGPNVRVFGGQSFALLSSTYAFGDDQLGGVSVG